MRGHFVQMLLHLLVGILQNIITNDKNIKTNKEFAINYFEYITLQL